MIDEILKIHVQKWRNVLFKIISQKAYVERMKKGVDKNEHVYN